MNLYFLDLLKSDRPRFKVEIKKENQDKVLPLSDGVRKKIANSFLTRVKNGYLTRLIWSSDLSSNIIRGKRIRYKFFFRTLGSLEDGKKIKYIITTFDQRKKDFTTKVVGNGVTIWL
jgi:hypothetical protein